jgi:biopolymer transport protein ExbB
MTSRTALLPRLALIALLVASACWSAEAFAQAQPPGSAAQGDGEAAPASRGGITGTVAQLFEALDYWIWPFAIATFIDIWFIVERLVVLRRGRVIPKPFVQRFLKLLEEGELDRDEALEICAKNGSPVAQVFAHGVRKWDKPSVEVEQAIIDGGERQVSSLRSHLRVINGVATITPMLGLLGTVWGMLVSFQNVVVAGATGNTSQLASGIAMALVTTAAGLIIAIPTLVAYMYLSGRIDALVMEMDQLAQSVVENVSSEALTERAARPRKVAAARSEAAAAGQKKAV